MYLLIHICNSFSGIYIWEQRSCDLGFSLIQNGTISLHCHHVHCSFSLRASNNSVLNLCPSVKCGWYHIVALLCIIEKKWVCSHLLIGHLHFLLFNVIFAYFSFCAICLLFIDLTYICVCVCVCVCVCERERERERERVSSYSRVISDVPSN